MLAWVHTCICNSLWKGFWLVSKSCWKSKYSLSLSPTRATLSSLLPSMRPSVDDVSLCTSEAPSKTYYFITWCSAWCLSFDTRNKVLSDKSIYKDTLWTWTTNTRKIISSSSKLFYSILSGHGRKILKSCSVYSSGAKYIELALHLIWGTCILLE